MCKNLEFPSTKLTHSAAKIEEPKSRTAPLARKPNFSVDKAFSPRSTARSQIYMEELKESFPESKILC